MPRARIVTALLVAVTTVGALLVVPSVLPAAATPVGVPPSRVGGSVVAWGDGSTPAPPALASQTVVAVSANLDHALAVTASGSVVAWGDDAAGQSTVPAQLVTERSIAVAAGADHSLALTASHQVVAWGSDSDGQTDVPSALTGETVVAIAAGLRFSMALTDAGRVYTWGAGAGGALAVPTGALTQITAIAAGLDHALALNSDGQVIAWGDNAYGAATVPSSLDRTQVTAIAAGTYTSLALTAAGQVVPWGNNQYHQNAVPHTVSNSTTAAIALGQDDESVAVDDTGRLRVWGKPEGGVTDLPAALKGRRVTAAAAGFEAVYAVLAPPTTVGHGPLIPSDGITPTPLVGQPAGFDQTQSTACDEPLSNGQAHALALTGVGLDYVTGYDSDPDNPAQREGVADLVASCQPFVNASATQDGTVPPLQHTIGGFADGEVTGEDQPTPSVLCPSGTVVVGMDANLTPDAAVADLRPYCETLGADGVLQDDRTAADWVRGDSGTYEGRTSCAEGSYAVGVQIARYDFVDGVQLLCATPLYDTGLLQPDNSSWLTAKLLAPNDSVQQNLTSSAGARWYKVPVQPNAQFGASLTDLPANDDLTVFSDIGQAFASAASPEDLTRLSAEAAGTTFSPTTFSPTTFSPTTFSPTMFSPTTFSPTTFSPTTFSPTTFSPTTFSPTTFSPTTFSPTTFSPYITPDLYTKVGAFTDLHDFEDAYSSAQSRSVLVTSANEGTAPESVTGNTQNHTGFFYLRVTARNGAGSTLPYTLSVAAAGGPCTVALSDYINDSTITGQPGASTVVLTDPARLSGAGGALARANTAFASSVDGGAAIVDLADSQRVRDLNAQADANPGCPYAKNLVAQAIRDIVNSYRGGAGSLKYVVLEGDDAVIPYFRYADTAGVAGESGFAPPVTAGTASRASLANNLVLSQDAYGSAIDLAVGGISMPVPDLAVGRLVETPDQIATTLNDYANGITRDIPVSSTLATGYDFLTAGARAVGSNFADGNPDGRNDTLITDDGVPPSRTTVGGRPDPSSSWTAADLKQTLLGTRHDLLYLAGHFSASEALAADFATRVSTADVATASPTPSSSTFLDSLVISPGCHSGYNVVDQDGIAGVTDTLDWAQEFAAQGATLIAGTGYQYGDTDFIKYSNALYVALSKRLRTGTGPVSIGAALAQAKTDYLAQQAGLSGVDQKSLLEATLYGLPMQTLTMAADGRIDPPTVPGALDTTPAASDPGRTLGLSTSDVSIDPLLRHVTTTLTGNHGASTTASYYAGQDGVESDPAAPALPLIVQNATAPSGTVLRGVGFWSGSYHDTDGVTPLTGAPATETGTVHGPFVSSVFYPNTLATPNYSSALGGSTGTGETRLMVTPAQYRSDRTGSPTDTERTYSSLGFRLFYSGNTSTYGGNTPALAAAPTMSGTTASVDRSAGTVTYSTHVVGDPAAGIHEVWVTYTDPGADAPIWTSVDLAQDAHDSTLWSVSLPLTGTGAGLQFFMQAANGVGVVGADNNAGHYYTPGRSPVVTDKTDLEFSVAPPARVTTGTTLAVSAQLTTDGAASVQGRPVTFTLDGASVIGRTDAQGLVRVTLPVTSAPGAGSLTASFAGVGPLGASTTGAYVVTVVKRTPTLCMTADGAGNLTVQLTRAVACSPAASGIPSHTVFVVGVSDIGAVEGVVPVVTGGDGTATIPIAELPAAASTATAYFGALSTPVPRRHNVLAQPDPVYRAARSASLPVLPDHIAVSGPGTMRPDRSAPFTTTGYTADDVSRGELSSVATLTITPVTDGSAMGASCVRGSCRASVAGTYRVRASYRGLTDSTLVTVVTSAPDRLRVI